MISKGTQNESTAYSKRTYEIEFVKFPGKRMYLTNALFENKILAYVDKYFVFLSDITYPILLIFVPRIKNYLLNFANKYEDFCWMHEKQLFW